MDDPLLHARTNDPRRSGDATMSLSRRTLFKAAGVGAAVTAFAPGWVSPAAAAVPSSPMFDLTDPSQDFFPERNRPLHERRNVMQSFSFDNDNHRLFVAQLQDGTSGDDLCINELDFDGNVLGTMHVNGAGHGVSTAAESVGDDTYLWTEADSDRDDRRGRGTALQRFKWVSGETPSDARKFLRGSANVTCSIDPVHRRLLVRRFDTGRPEFTVYRLADAASGDFSDPLTHVRQPGVEGTFQGYAFYGRYAYLLTGRGHADAEDIDSKLSCVDLNTGDLRQANVMTRAGRALVWREPEGVAVYRGRDGQVRLHFGMASRDSVDGDRRFANIFYKSALVD